MARVAVAWVAALQLSMHMAPVEGMQLWLTSQEESIREPVLLPEAALTTSANHSHRYGFADVATLASHAASDVGTYAQKVLVWAESKMSELQQVVNKLWATLPGKCDFAPELCSVSVRSESASSNRTANEVAAPAAELHQLRWTPPLWGDVITACTLRVMRQLKPADWSSDGQIGLEGVEDLMAKYMKKATGQRSGVPSSQKSVVPSLICHCFCGLLFLLGAVAYIRHASRTYAWMQLKYGSYSVVIPALGTPHGLLTVAALFAGIVHLSSLADIMPLKPSAMTAISRMVSAAALSLSIGHVCEVSVADSFPAVLLSTAAFAFLTVADVGMEAPALRWSLFVASAACGLGAAVALTRLVRRGDEGEVPKVVQVPLDCFRSFGCMYLLIWLHVETANLSERAWEADLGGSLLDVLFLMPTGHILLKRLAEEVNASKHQDEKPVTPRHAQSDASTAGARARKFQTGR